MLAWQVDCFLKGVTLPHATVVKVFHAQLNWAWNLNCTLILKYLESKDYPWFKLLKPVIYPAHYAKMPSLWVLKFMSRIMSRINFMFSWFGHKQSFIALGSGLTLIYEPRHEKTGLQGFPTKSDTNWAAHSLKVARGLKFWIYEVEGLYYTCSKNKGADQLCGYRTTDLRLCFSHMRKSGFLT